MLYAKLPCNIYLPSDGADVYRGVKLLNSLEAVRKVGRRICEYISTTDDDRLAEKIYSACIEAV